MTLKDWVLGGGVALAIVIAIVFSGGTNTTTEKFGVAAGPDVYQNTFFHAGMTYGENCFSTTTTGTLSATGLANYSCLHIAAAGAGQAALTITLPASSTLNNLVPKAGNCREWFIDANDVAAATTTTFVAGTGMNDLGLDATGAGTGADVIDGDEYGRLTMCRQANSDIATFLTEWIHSD